MHDTNQDGAVYRDHEGDGGEYRRAMGHACAGLRLGSPAAYDPAEGGWEAFYCDGFADVIAPHFVACYSAAVAGQAARLDTLEAQFCERLSAPVRDRLIDSSHAVFDARTGASALKLIDRLARRDHGCTLTTAFAVHAAGFHVPLLHALVAYLSVEWRAGEAPRLAELENPAAWRTMFERQLLDSPEPVQEILARNLCSWAEVA